jgi:hypothetical protein
MSGKAVPSGTTAMALCGGLLSRVAPAVVVVEKATAQGAMVPPAPRAKGSP